MKPSAEPTDATADTAALVQALAQRLQSQSLWLATAESCTGGLIAAACTDRPGSSAWFERGFVTYSNAAKTELLGVPTEWLQRHGAVSQPVAQAMALGALRQSKAQWSVAVTGIAGPGGGSADKPVGLVWLAWAGPHGCSCEQAHFSGDRAAVRSATVTLALSGLLARLGPVHAQAGPSA